MIGGRFGTYRFLIAVVVSSIVCAALLPGSVPIAAQITDEKPIRILFAGDTHFLWGVRDEQKKRGLNSPVAKIRPLFLGADYRLLNLETVISKNGKSVNNKTYVFESDPENVDLLRFLNIDSVFLANNHTFDLGGDGVDETMKHLAAAEIGFTGIGKTEKDANQPLIAKIDGLTIAFFSLSAVGPYDTVAKGDQPGTAGPTASFFAELRRVRYQVDLIIVGAHWGFEYEVVANASQRDLARRLIREGADAVIGHHPHIPQGTEFISGKPVIYSLGNFLFGSANYQQTVNLIAVLQIDRKTKRIIAVELHPITGRYRTDGYVLDIAADIDRFNFWQEYYLLSKQLDSSQKMILEDGYRRMIVSR